MACKKELANWLFDNRESLNLTVLKGQWVKEWLPDFHDVRVQIELEGRVYEGRGMDKNADLAFTRAGAEVIERAVIYHSKLKSSNGIALHAEEPKAKENALYELLERDQFLCHFFTTTPFAELNPFIVKELEIDFEYIREKLEKESIEITLKRTLFSNPTTAICLARKVSAKGFNGILGLGASDTLSKSASKAIAECLTNVVWYMDNELHAEGLEGLHPFNSKQVHGPQDHHKLYLGNSNECDLDWVFSLSRSESESIRWEGKVTFHKIDVPFQSLETAPIHIFKATSNEVQNVFYGLTKEENLNMERLEQFKGKSLLKEDINWNPHPIG